MWVCFHAPTGWFVQIEDAGLGRFFVLPLFLRACAETMYAMHRYSEAADLLLDAQEVAKGLPDISMKAEKERRFLQTMCPDILAQAEMNANASQEEEVRCLRSAQASKRGGTDLKVRQ